MTRLRIIIIVMLSCVLIATVLILKWGFEDPPVKATWVWSVPTASNDRNEMLGFAQEQGVTVIYLQVNRKSTDLEPYREFIEEAHRQGMEVEALGGDPRWGLSGYQQDIQSFVGWIEDYQRSAGEQAAFDGIHVDIEPYLLEDWKKDQEHVVRQWTDNMEYLVQEAKRNTSLRISADLPFWIHKISAPNSDTNLGAWMIERFDSIVLMNYRNFAVGSNGIIATALPMVKEGTRIGKPVIIGLETAPTNEGEHTTFFKEGTSSLNWQMRLSHNFLRRYSGYGGFSIHDYERWRETANS